jgi:hypothetical protein
MNDEVNFTYPVKPLESSDPPAKKPRIDFAILLANRVNESETNKIDKSIQIEFEKYLNELNVDMKVNVFE